MMGSLKIFGARALEMLSVLLAVSAVAVAQERALPDDVRLGHMRFEAMPAAIEEQLMKSIFAGALPPELVTSVSLFSEKSLQGAWEGSKPEVTAEVNGMVFRFRRDPDDQRGESGPETFDLLINYLGRELVVRSTAARRSELRVREGLRLPPKPNGGWIIFVEGTARTGIVFIAPPSTSRHNAFLVCPRYNYRFRQERSRAWQSALVDSGYRVGRIMFSAEGLVRGKALSGGGVGYAWASILTSPTIARSEEYSDEAYGRDPRINLAYRARTSDITREIEMDGEVIGGIQAELVFHRPSGHKRRTSSQGVAWIKERILLQDYTIPVMVGKKTVPMTLSRGTCYLVAQQIRTEHHFLRETFELPERLKAGVATPDAGTSPAL